MARVLVRLALVHLRRGPVAAVLTLLFLTCTTTTIGLAATVHAQVGASWQQAFDRAHGPHLVVSGASHADLGSLAEDSAVSERTPLLRQVFGTMHVDGRDLLVRLREAGPSDPPVDRPLHLVGSWARPGQAVLEATAAAALGVRVGDHVRLGMSSARGFGPPAVQPVGAGVDVLVGGIARVIGQNAFPQSQPGLLLVHPADLARVVGNTPTGWTVELRLRNPATGVQIPPNGERVATSWQELRASADEDLRTQQVVLGTFALLLAAVAAAGMVTLVVARTVADARLHALWRTVGLTPHNVLAVQLIEQAAIAATASALGIVLSSRLAPRITDATAAALPSSRSPGTLVLAGIVVATVALACASTVLATHRAHRRSTSAALAEAAGASSFGRSRLASFGERLGLPWEAVLGLRVATARPGRRMLAAGSLSLGVAAAVACLAMDATIDAEARSTTTALPGFVSAASAGQLRPVAYSLMAVLAVLALCNVAALVHGWQTENRRDHAVLAAVGMTPFQLVLQTVVASASTALFGAVLGVPLGALLFLASYSLAHGDTAGAHAAGLGGSLAAAVLAVVVVAGLTALLALPSARRRPAPRLRVG